MFCSKCGAEINEKNAFCPSCGNPIESTKTIDNDTVKSVSENSEKTTDESINIDKTDSVGSTSEHNETKFNNGLFNKLWNNPKFADLAIKFDQICDYLYIPFGLVMAFILFGEGGFLGILFGVAFVLASLHCVLRIVNRRKKQKEFFEQNSICPSCGKQSNTKNFCSNCGAQMPKLSARELEDEGELSDESIMNKKKKLLWAPVVLLIIILVVSSGVLQSISGHDPIDNTKSITLDGYSHSMGAMARNHIKSATWEKEKIDKDSYYVTVEGYCTDLGEDLKLKFRYQDLGDEYRVKILSATLPESGEEYTDFFSIAVVLKYLDKDIEK